MGSMSITDMIRDYSMDYWRVRGYTDEQIWDAYFKSFSVLLNENLRKTFSRRSYYVPTKAEVVESILRKDELVAGAIIRCLRREWANVEATSILEEIK